MDTQLELKTGNNNSVRKGLLRLEGPSSWENVPSDREYYEVDVPDGKGGSVFQRRDGHPERRVVPRELFIRMQGLVDPIIHDCPVVQDNYPAIVCQSLMAQGSMEIGRAKEEDPYGILLDSRDPLGFRVPTHGEIINEAKLPWVTTREHVICGEPEDGARKGPSFRGALINSQYQPDSAVFARLKLGYEPKNPNRRESSNALETIKEAGLAIEEDMPNPCMFLSIAALIDYLSSDNNERAFQIERWKKGKRGNYSLAQAIEHFRRQGRKIRLSQELRIKDLRPVEFGYALSRPDFYAADLFRDGPPDIVHGWLLAHGIYRYNGHMMAVPHPQAVTLHSLFKVNMSDHPMTSGLDDKSEDDISLNSPPDTFMPGNHFFYDTDGMNILPSETMILGGSGAVMSYFDIYERMKYLASRIFNRHFLLPVGFSFMALLGEDE